MPMSMGCYICTVHPYETESGILDQPNCRKDAHLIDLIMMAMAC
jgi:hypothetical protein